MAEHDQLFKRIFRVPEHAAGELRSVLPPELVEAIDFDSLERIQGDSVSRRLNDALFSATFRGVRGKIPGFVWLLLEHQSEPEHLMVLRVLEYSVRAWLDLVREDPNIRALPPIVCVVVHHGEQGWTAPTRLHELIPDLAEVPWLRGFVPDFEIIIDDLVRAPDYRLQSRPLTTVVHRV